MSRGRAGAALVAALPIALIVCADRGGLAPFGPIKALAFFVLVPAAAAAWLRGSVHVDRSSAVAWSVFLAIGALAAALGVDHLYAWTGTAERHFGWMTWLACAAVFVLGQQLDERVAKTVAITSAIAIGVAGLWAVAELLGWHPIALAGAGDRPVGPLGSSAYLGAAAVLLGPVAVGVAAGSRRVAWLPVAFAGVALVASGARAAWVGALVAGAFWLLARRASTRVAAIVVAGAIAGAFAFGVASRVPDLVHARDGGLHGRLDEWRVAARVIANHPVVGVGPEGYRVAFGQSVDAVYEQRHGRDPLPDRAHNAVLDVAATTGVIGALAYLALVVVVGRAVVRAVRRGPALIATMAIGLVGYAMQSLFLFPVAELDPIAWLMAGIVVAATLPDASTWRVPRLVSVVAAVVAFTAFVAGALDVAADRRARAIIAALADDRLPNGDLPRRLRPDVLRYQLLAARAAEARATPSGFATALADIDRALALSPRDPVALAERARVQVEQARFTGDRGQALRARATLERLVGRDPYNAEAWLRLGIAAALLGDDAGAERAWKRAERLAPRSAAAPADLALAYARQERWPEAATEARRALARDPGNQQARDVLRQNPGTKGGP